MAEVAIKNTTNVRLKSVALPVEHGGWGFLGEPILLGLFAAFSVSGFFIGVAALGVFLIQHPLKMALKDRLKDKYYPRTVWAERFAMLYAAIALVGIVLALLTAHAPFWLPIVVAIPFAVIQMIYGANNHSRDVIPQVSGAIALGAGASAIALAGGWTLTNALMLWVILAIRAATSIVYVRARLRLERNIPTSVALPIVAHVLGVLIVGGLALAKLTPWLGVVLMVILLARAAYGLSSFRKSVPPKIIGFQELGYGLLMVVMVAAGYWLSL